MFVYKRSDEKKGLAYTMMFFFSFSDIASYSFFDLKLKKKTKNAPNKVPFWANYQSLEVFYEKIGENIRPNRVMTEKKHRCNTKT